MLSLATPFRIITLSKILFIYIIIINSVTHAQSVREQSVPGRQSNLNLSTALLKYTGKPYSIIPSPYSIEPKVELYPERHHHAHGETQLRKPRV